MAIHFGNLRESGPGTFAPTIVISPFPKPHYVSHTVGDRTSLLAFIEKRFLSTEMKVVETMRTAAST